MKDTAICVVCGRVFITTAVRVICTKCRKEGKS